MSPEEILHFLVILDENRDEPEVVDFGNDYDAAIAEYERREKHYRDEDRAEEVDIVLLSADSLDTVKKTHSSYFDGKREHGFAKYIPA